MYLKYRINFETEQMKNTNYMSCILNTYFKYLYFTNFTALNA